MGSPAAATPPATPKVQAPPAGLSLARWLYVDERRTHQVHAGFRGAEVFVARESAFGNEDAAEVFETATPLASPLDGRLAVHELEKRLGLLGRYWRFDLQAKDGWAEVPRDAFERLDLRPAQSETLAGRVAFHHFHDLAGPAIVLLVVPHPTPAGPRGLVARAAMDLRRPEEGTLQVLHARLPEGPARSLLAREQLQLEGRGHAKLVTPAEFQAALGRGWERDVATAYTAALRRLAEGKLGPGEGPRHVPVDPVYTDYVAALTDPRLIALHAKYLAEGEEERLLAAGEAAIRQAIARKRTTTPLSEQHLLNVLQASLLARDALRTGHAVNVDPEVSALVRRFAYYL